MSNIIPEVWNEWNIEETIGSGAYGTVYRASNAAGELSAIKVINIPSSREEEASVRREFREKASVISFYKSLVEDYEKEIEVLESLGSCPNIVRILDHYKEPQGVGWRLYIRMEHLQRFADYCDITDVGESEVIDIGIQICTALEECGKHNILHRDIKPDNILVDENGCIKLADFGLARRMDNADESLSRKGTFNYMAPEVYLGRKYNSQADIYSLGLILYRLMNRRKDPFIDISSRVVLYKDVEQALRRRMEGDAMPAPVDASENLASIILKACAFKTSDRYTSATEMKRDLERLKTGSYKKPALTNTGKRRAMATAAVATAFIISCGAYAWTQMHGVNAKLADGVLTVRGSGTVCAEDVADYQTEATSIVIEDGITRIGADAFGGFSEVQSISIPESVTEIGENAFAYDTLLKEITLPSGVTTVPEGCLGGCSELEHVTLADGTTEIGDYAFLDCKKLGDIEGVDAITDIGEEALTGTAWMENNYDEEGFCILNGNLLKYGGESGTIQIPDSVTVIKAGAFEGNQSIGSVRISENVKVIEENAFMGSQLEELIIDKPEGLESIGEYAFANTPWSKIQRQNGDTVVIGNIEIDTLVD